MKTIRRAVLLLEILESVYAVAAGDDRDSVTVAEISSFQLETIDDFIRSSAILEYHTGSSEPSSYNGSIYQGKKILLRIRQKIRYCVLNYEDEAYKRIWRKKPANVLYFSSAA